MLELKDYAAPSFDHLLVTVVMQRCPSASRWQDYSWQLVDVLVNSHLEESDNQQSPLLIDKGECQQYLYPQFELKLFKDQTESYYYNITTDNPTIFVICEHDDNNTPTPFMVTASFDEASSYLETEEHAYSTPMPAEIYQWLEGYILTHYLPEKRKKRKRKNWTENDTQISNDGACES